MSQTDSQPDFHEYAGFFRRFGAALIDSIFYLFVTVVVHFLIADSASISFYVDQGGFGFDSNSGWTEQLVIALITIGMWKKLMGTPGKLLLECHVVDAQTGNPVTFVQGLTRYVAYIISIIPFGLGFFWILWDKRKQGFHDKIAKTVVVRETAHFSDDESAKSLEQLLREVR